jgi:tRNA-specific adenosine deaminase 1
MGNGADDIAAVVLGEFRKLPAKRRPAVRDNGLREWVPLSGIVVRGTLATLSEGFVRWSG